MATYKGKTEDAASPILGASWWEKGKRIMGRVVRSFRTANGTCYELKLGSPVVVGDFGLIDRVSVGALKGFGMALAAAGLDGLRRGDSVLLECTGSTATEKGNPMVNFVVEVDRPVVESSDAPITDEDIPF